MCGICGYVSNKNVSLEELNKMNATMIHRGPNDYGEEIYPLSSGFYLGLAHRRLSILDLSSMGHQPMHSADKRVSVVYNGEIYNFTEIKEQLSDYPFISQCDTEVILAAYLKWGISCVDRFNGMFAIALFDREDNTLYLIRDRIGKKPLYYWINGEDIVFASELKPIMLFPGFKEDINKDVMAFYLYHGYINHPMTIFRNVYKVEPGEIVNYHFGGIKKTKYWQARDSFRWENDRKALGYEETKKELKELLFDSVKKRMIADVPVGTFLSGGYDSTLVTAIATQLSSQPVKTFCIGFEDPKFNEALYAKEIAKHLGTDHHELYMTEADMFDMLEDMCTYYDEPFGDSSQIATMAVSKLAKSKITVALSGDGGDEFFCGYKNYDDLYSTQKYDKIGMLLNSLLKYSGLKKTRIYEKIPYRIRMVVNNSDSKTKTQYGLEVYEKKIREILADDIAVSLRFDESVYPSKNWQKKGMVLDQENLLAGDMLCKVDRASMKYSLETRCPLLDYRVMEYANRMPQEYKYFHKEKKRILKDIAYDYVPKEMLERPKKGFSVPIEAWMKGMLKERLYEYCDEAFLKRQGIFEAGACNAFIRNFLEGTSIKMNWSPNVWHFFVFQMWYEKYVKQ